MMDNYESTGSPQMTEPGLVAQMVAHVRISIIATLVLAVIVCGVYPAIVWGLAQALFHHQANGSLIKHDGTNTDNDSEAVGSSWLGQPFAGAGYFHPRPSAAGNGYDPTQSAGTNLGPMSAKLLLGTTQPTTLPATQPSGQPLPGPDSVAYDGIADRIVHYCLDNNIGFETSAPLSNFKDKDGNIDDVKLIEAFNDSNTPLKVTPAVEIPADAVTASASGLDPHISARNAEIQAKRVADARNIEIAKVKEVIDEFTEGRSLGVFGDPGVKVLMLNLALDAKYPLPAPPATAPAAVTVTQPVTLPTTEPAGK